MKYILSLILLFTTTLYGADIKISQLPLGSGASVGVNDSFPYVQASTLITKRLTIYDLVNVPLFVQTYAPIANPTFTGVVTAPSFVGPLTGTASGNTTYTPNNHGVVLSGSSNAMSVLAPSSSTAFPLVSGGSSANPSWSLLSVAGGGTGLSSGTSGGILGFTASGTLASSGVLTANQLIVGGGAGVTPSTLAAGSQYQVLTMGASNPGYGAVNLSQSAAVTGVLPLINGGTNKAMTASAGSIAYSDSDSLEFTSVGSNGQLIQSAGTGTPAWTTATFPSTATGTGSILRADGTNWSASSATYPNTTTANQILYSSATNVIGQITTAATSALVTNSSSVPSLTSGSTANRLLRTDGTTVSFAQAALATDVSGTLPIANGGTNNGSLAVTAGGVLYTDGSKVVNVGAGSAGTFLQSQGASAPTWVASSPTFAVASTQTSTYAIQTTDGVIPVDASSGSFTATLPTAVGVTGKIYTIKRVDQTLANVVTLATTSSQTIDGATTRKLAVQYEWITVISNGANWLIQTRGYPGTSVSYTPTTQGFGTPTEVTVFWQRRGDLLRGYGTFRAGAYAASTAFIKIPSGVTIKTSGISAATNAAQVGNWHATNNSTAQVFSGSFNGILFFDGSTTDTVFMGTNSGGTDRQYTKANGNTMLNGTTEYISFDFEVPITDWE